MPGFFVLRRWSTAGPMLRGLAVGSLAVVVGLVSARVASSHYGTGAVAILIAGPALLYLASRPLAGMTAVALLLGTIFAYSVVPRANLPGRPPIDVADALLGVLLLGTVWRRPWRSWPKPIRGYAGMLVLLLALASISSVRIALTGADAARNASLGIKNILYLTLAITIALELRGKLWRPLLTMATVLGALVAVLSIAAALSGGFASALNHFDPQSSALQTSTVSFGSTARIRLPGLFFAYGMLIPTIVMAVVEPRWRRLRIVTLLLMIAAVALSLNRNMYFGSLIGLAVAALIGGPRLRHRLALSVLVVAITGVLVIESVKPAGTAAIEQRAGSALSSQVLQTNSAQDRAVEYQYALIAISHHPWAGVGWQQSYGFPNEQYIDTPPRTFVEDIYLHMATDYGIPFAVLFILMQLGLIGYGIRRARRTANSVDRAIVAGFTGGVIALLLSALLGTYLQVPDTTASFAMICGMLLAAGLRTSAVTTGAPTTVGPEELRGRSEPPSRSAGVVASRPPAGAGLAPMGPRRPAPANGRRLRVVVTCDWFLKYACEQAVGLSESGAVVTLLCRSHSIEFGGRSDERTQALATARAAGVSVLEIPGRLSDPRTLLKLGRLRTRLAHFAPQVVHAHDGADPRALGLLAGIPTVLTLHDPTPHPGHPGAQAHKRWLLTGSRDAWRTRAQAIVVHSQRLAEELGPADARRSTVIAHGLSMLSEPLAPPETPTVAMFGRLEPYKGLDVLARAMPLVWRRRPEVQVQLAGAGSAAFPLQDERAKVFRGYVPEDQVTALFGRASLVVLPYTQASQTGVGSRAVGLGVPVVVSRLGGLPELALDDSYVVAPGGAAELAEAILNHIDDDLATRRRVLAEVAEPRSWRAVGTETLALYERVLARR